VARVLPFTGSVVGDRPRREVVLAVESYRSLAAVTAYGALFARAFGASLRLLHWNSSSAIVPLVDAWVIPGWGSHLVATVPAPDMHSRLLAAAAQEQSGLVVEPELIEDSGQALASRFSSSDLAIAGLRRRSWRPAFAWPSVLAQLAASPSTATLVIPEAASTPPITRIVAVADPRGSSVPLEYAVRIREALGVALNVAVPETAEKPARRPGVAALLSAGIAATKEERRTLIVLPVVQAAASRFERTSSIRALQSSPCPVLMIPAHVACERARAASAADSPDRNSK